MTTLYRLVPIESAEQAEAMPPGTVALRSWGDGTTARTLTNGRWITPSGGAMPHVETVGFTALVPIEAEEETRSVARHPGGGQTNYNTEAAGNPGRMGEYIASLPVESRLVTPWESV